MVIRKEGKYSMEWKDRIDSYQKKREEIEIGNITKNNIQHSKGKLTARERIAELLDKNTFCEMYTYMESRSKEFDMDIKKALGDGVIVGYGKILGQTVFIISEDFTIMGGTVGEQHAIKICKILEAAKKSKSPVVFIHDSGGARIEEGIDSLEGYAKIFRNQVEVSGIIPQIALVIGPCAGGACYGPALCDFIITVKEITRMFITGPDVVKAAIGEVITAEELGDAKVHSEKSGVAHFYCENEKEAYDTTKSLLKYICNIKQDNCKAKKLILKDKSITDLVPVNSKKVYDMTKVIEMIIDKNCFLEIQKDFAPNIIIGFAQINSRTVGIVANQPRVNAGTIDCNSSDKAARFVRFCDSFSIPIISFVDVPGYFPGSKQEYSGIIRHGAKLIYAFAEASVLKISIIIRKAYGGAYIAMNSKGLGADFVYAWPTAEIAVMGGEAAVKILGRNKTEDEKYEIKHLYDDANLTPYLAGKRGYVTDIIEPRQTREKIVSALEFSDEYNSTKKTHGNIPL